MKYPLNMYSKVGNLKIIKFWPNYKFVGSLNHSITSGLIVSSKLPKIRKDGMSFKYSRYNYMLTQDLGKFAKIPLSYELKLLAKKYINILILIG